MWCVYVDFVYMLNSIDIMMLVFDVLWLCKGVCQDFVYVMIGVLCLFGLVVCYVSGYLFMQLLLGQLWLIGVDVLYVWVDVYDLVWFEDGGWLQFDLINDWVLGDDYVMLLIGCDYVDVMLLCGVICGGGVDQELKVGVMVELFDVV